MKEDTINWLVLVVVVGGMVQASTGLFSFYGKYRARTGKRRLFWHRYATVQGNALFGYYISSVHTFKLMAILRTSQSNYLEVSKLTSVMKANTNVPQTSDEIVAVSKALTAVTEHHPGSNSSIPPPEG